MINCVCGVGGGLLGEIRLSKSQHQLYMSPLHGNLVDQVDSVGGLIAQLICFYIFWNKTNTKCSTLGIRNFHGFQEVKKMSKNAHCLTQDTRSK